MNQYRINELILYRDFEQDQDGILNDLAELVYCYEGTGAVSGIEVVYIIIFSLCDVL